MPRKLIDYTQRGKKLGPPPPAMKAGCSMRSLQPCFDGEQAGGRHLSSNCSAISDDSCNVPNVLDLSFADFGLEIDGARHEESVDFMMKIPSRQQQQQQQQKQVSSRSNQNSLRVMFSRQRSDKLKKTSILQSVLGDLTS